MRLQPTTSRPIAFVLLAAVAATCATPQASAWSQTPAAKPAVAAQPAAERLACSGRFAADATHASLVAAFGKDVVALQKVDGAEGEKIEATVIFPKQPAKRLEVFWVDEKKRAGIASVRLGPTATWIAPNGLRIGASLGEVEKANGRPFDLSGFDWDYGGTVTDWKGGALAEPSPGGCRVSVGFLKPQNAPAAAADAVAGDTTFASTDKNMRAVKPVVGSLAFGYPQPEQ